MLRRAVVAQGNGLGQEAVIDLLIETNASAGQKPWQSVRAWLVSAVVGVTRPPVPGAGLAPPRLGVCGGVPAA